MVDLYYAVKDFFSYSARYLIQVSNPRIFVMGIHLGQNLEASDKPDSQEQAVWAVRVKGPL